MTVTLGVDRLVHLIVQNLLNLLEPIRNLLETHQDL